jgi:acetoin utilization deacetylase AcuC-like enzyme
VRVRVTILDIDYHHGNGTQEIFYTDPTVLYCSLHAHPDDDYPFYWGESNETGEGPGAGYNRNWPLLQGAGDDIYLATLDEALAVIFEFAPRYLIVSLGLDTFTGDPVGGFNLTTAGLAEIGHRIVGLGLPTIIVQEGGYLLEKLGENAVAFLKALA